MFDKKQKRVFFPSGKVFRSERNGFSTRNAILSYLDKFDSAVRNLEAVSREEAQEETAAISARFARYGG